MTKENIIIAALRLFVIRGYKSVSLIDVAAEIGITKGGIYHYFSSKDALLEAGLHYLLDRLEAKYQEVLGERNSIREILQALLVEKKLERYAKTLLGVEGEHSIDCAHFVVEIMGKFPAIQARMEAGRLTVCAALGGRIETAVKQGELRSNLDSYAVAALILAAANGQLSLGRPLQTPQLRTRMLDSIWQLLALPAC